MKYYVSFSRLSEKEEGGCLLNKAGWSAPVSVLIEMDGSVLLQRCRPASFVARDRERERERKMQEIYEGKRSLEAALHTTM